MYISTPVLDTTSLPHPSLPGLPVGLYRVIPMGLYKCSPSMSTLSVSMSTLAVVLCTASVTYMASAATDRDEMIKELLEKDQTEITVPVTKDQWKIISNVIPKST